MKKFIFLSLIAAGIISCEKEGLDPIDDTPIELVDQKTINSYKSWEEFHNVYSQYSEISDLAELEANSLYEIDKDNREYSPALQGIINEDNQFKVGNDIIELDKGTFRKITSKDGAKEYESVGTVNLESTILDDSSGILTNQRITSLSPFKASLYEVKPFRQRRYINCQNGIDHGSAPRSFRYLHQIYAEYVVTPGYVRTYTLFLRLYLEYNHRGNSWRLSGENREISINVTDRSVLVSPQPPFILSDFSGNPGTYNIRFNSSCSSHKVYKLREHRTGTSAYFSPEWSVNLSGTIVEKMSGDNDAWNHSINY